MSSVGVPSIAKDDVGPDGLEIMSEFISLFCVTVLAAALGAKTKGESLADLTYGRALVLLLYILSWSFCAISIVVISTNDFNPESCAAGILTCDICYAGTKIVIYAWLIERVHLVSSIRTPRLKSTQYRIHLLLLTPYIGIATLMLMFRFSYLDENGTCYIGLKQIASIPLMIYDFVLNLYLTFLFVKPLITTGRSGGDRKDWTETRLYRLTRRTLTASLICLIVSFANILVVVITRGHERGLMCLTMCTADVTINVVVVHWVTTSKGKMSVRNTTTVHGGCNTNSNSGGSPTQRLSREDLILDGRTVCTDYPKVSVYDPPADDNESQRSIQVSQASMKPLQAQS